MLAGEMELTWAFGANCEMSMTQYKMILSCLGLKDFVGRMRGRRFLEWRGRGGGEEGGVVRAVVRDLR